MHTGTVGGGSGGRGVTTGGPASVVGVSGMIGVDVGSIANGVLVGASTNCGVNVLIGEGIGVTVNWATGDGT